MRFGNLNIFGGGGVGGKELLRGQCEQGKAILVFLVLQKATAKPQRKYSI